MYDQVAQIQLLEKLDYELWLLDLISNTLKTFRGGTDISTITIINRQADLKFVRQQLAPIYPSADVQFNLEIIGLINNKPTARWNMPAEAVPEIDILELPSVSFEMFRTSLPKGD